MSNYLRKVCELSSAIILIGAMSGCATYGKFGFQGCPGDAQLTANVRARLDQHPVLGAPNLIEVQTFDHVVYLNGMVSQGLEGREAESVALEAPGVTHVVNLLAVTH